MKRSFTHCFLLKGGLLTLGALLAMPGTLSAAGTSEAFGSNQLKELPAKRAMLPKGMQLQPKRVAHPADADEYLLLGKSAFNDEGETVIEEGGVTISYPIYLKFDESNGQTTFYGLFSESLGIDQQPVTMSWNPAKKEISASTPESFTDKSECLLINDETEEYGYIYYLGAGNPYGVGYWESLDEMKMSVSADRQVVVPQTGYSLDVALYDEWEEMWTAAGSMACLFNVQMFKRTDGCAAWPSKDNVNFGNCIINQAKTYTIQVMNSGRSESDYVLSCTSNAFSVSSTHGVIAPGEYVDLVITFNPTATGDYTGVLKIQTEDTDAVVNLSGTGVNLPEFAKIVTEGAEYITFDTDNIYPFELNETLADGVVAVSTNKGKGNTESWMSVTVNVPEGKRGTLNWEGYFYPRWASYDQFIITEGETELYATLDKGQYNGPIADKILLIPGEHTLKFAYCKGSEFNAPSITMGEDYAYLSSLSLQLSEYKELDARLSADSYDFGSIFKIDDGRSLVDTRENAVSITNSGYKNLQITGFANSEHFFGSTETFRLAPEDAADIDIAFKSDTFGTFEEDITVQTNAGDYVIHCKAELKEAPDYYRIVKQGDFTFEMGRSPFIVVDGRAVNNPTIPNDGNPVISEFSARFTVPTGKVGLLTWDGAADCGDGDYGMIMVDQRTIGMGKYKEKGDASYYTMNPLLCYFEPGEHIISFGYYQSGNSEWEGKREFSIGDLSLEFVDERPAVVAWQSTPVKFTPVYPGTAQPAKVTIWNLTEESMSVSDVKCSENYEVVFNEYLYSQIPDYTSTYFNLYFTPTEKGECPGTIEINASNGTVTVNLLGVGLDDSEVIFHDDFEKGLRWAVMDDDGDGNAWQGNTLFPYSGERSLSFSTTFARQDSEDYVQSPAVSIPEEGGVLSFYRYYTKPGNTHNFSVLVGTGNDFDKFTAIYSEDQSTPHKEKVHELITLPLTGFEGKTVSICLANKTPMSVNNFMLIDEFVVSKKGMDGINTVLTDMAVEKEYFTIDGLKVAYPTNGIYIVKETFENGSIRYRKIFIQR